MVSGKHLYRRDSGMHTVPFSKLHSENFPALETPGVLLDSAMPGVPEQLALWWKQRGELYRSTKGV